MKKLTQPIKIHGGKHDLANWIISLMPPRCKNPNKPDPKDKGWLAYVEPYFGGGSVLLANNPEGISEVVNDINGPLSLFWTVLRGGSYDYPAYQHYLEEYNSFLRAVNFTEFSKKIFDEASARLKSPNYGTPWEHAFDFFIVARQSLAGRRDSFASITRNRTRKGMNEQVSAWLNAVEGLPAVHARLKRVLILNRDAIEVIRKEDGPRVLFYLDPPYSHETRTSRKTYGPYEMTAIDHAVLLETLKNIEGRFLLSGYHSEMYDEWARMNKFKCHEFKINNHAAGGKKKRVMTECIWTNY